MKRNDVAQLNRTTKEKYSKEARLSIVKLLAAENALKLICVFFGMLVLEVLAFAIFGLRNRPAFLELAVFDARIALYILLAISFVITIIILSSELPSKNGKTVYTVQRLLLDEGTIFRISSRFNMAMLVIYLGFQTLAILIMILIFEASGLGNGGPQNIMMALYRSPFFHSIFPMQNWLYLLRNLIFVYDLGILTARQAQKSREGENAFALFIAIAVIGLVFIYNPLDTGVLAILAKDMIAVTFLETLTLFARTAGYDHRKDKLEDDEFKESLASYRNEDET